MSSPRCRSRCVGCVDDHSHGLDADERPGRLTRPQARQNLIAEFDLSTVKEAKPIMRAEDEFELLKTLWESPEMHLQHERLRVQLALMIQLAGITGNRPGALRRLQYKDLKIALLLDGNSGNRPRLVMDFTFEHTKRYHGAKDP